MDRTVDFRYAPRIIQTCIGRVDDEHKTIVREDGSVNYGFSGGNSSGPNSEQQTIEQDTLGFRHRLLPRFSHDDDPVNKAQQYGTPDEAIVTTVEEYEETTFEWTVFGYAADGYDEHETESPVADDSTPLRADVIRWTLVAEDGFGRAPSTVYLELDGDAQQLPDVIPCSDAPDGGETDVGRSDPVIREGDVWNGAFVIVHEGAIDAETVTVDWADDALQATHEYWAEVEPFRNELRVPDDGVNNMLTACGRNILQAREVHDGVTEYQVGPTTYRGLWIVDGHFLLEAAHFMGRGEDAFEQGLLALQRRVKPSGAIQDIPGHEKETGIAMATVVRQCELTDDDERLAELWPTLRRGLAFLKERHADAQARGEKYPARELFPPAFLDGGIGGPFPDYTTPLWILAGLKQAAKAGERLDLDGYEEFRGFYDTVWSGFESCAERDQRETDEGIPYIPMNMVDREYDNPQSATWAFAHAIYPGEVFEPDSAYVRNLLALLESVEVEGIPAGTGWIHDHGLWPYSAMFYAQAFLYAGRPAKAVDYLYAFANHAAPSRVWREEQPFSDSHADTVVGDMPHNWASAEFIRMVRNLLVFERGETLELLPGLPGEWLPDERPVVVSHTPTKFGKVSIELRRDGDNFELKYEREPGNTEPQEISLYWDGDVRGESITATGDGVHRIDPQKSSDTIRLQ